MSLVVSLSTEVHSDGQEYLVGHQHSTPQKPSPIHAK